MRDSGKKGIRRNNQLKLSRLYVHFFLIIIIIIIIIIINVTANGLSPGGRGYNACT
jgi:cytosine/uracil/thiamine/allantoin permease